jgi:transcriptional regulator with PAS, ATPase and Fis domain
MHNKSYYDLQDSLLKDFQQKLFEKLEGQANTETDPRIVAAIRCVAQAVQDTWYTLEAEALNRG